MTVKLWLKKKRVVIPAVLIVVYVLAGFFLVPPVLKPIIEDKLGRALDRRARVEKLAFNPLAFRFRAMGLSIAGKSEDPFVSVKELVIDIGVAHLFLLTPAIDRITVTQPAVFLARNKDNTFNFSDLVSPEKPAGASAAEAPEKGAEKKMIGFIIKNVSVLNGTVTFEDGKTGTRHVMEDLNIRMPKLSAKKKHVRQKTQLNCTWRLNDSQMALEFAAAFFAPDRETDIHFNTSAVNVVHYLSYLPVPDGIGLKHLDFTADIKAVFRQQAQKNHLTAQGNISLLNADVRDKKDDVLVRFPAFSVNIAPSDVLAGRIRLADCKLDTPVINLNRDETGQLEVLSYLPKAADKDVGAGPETAAPHSSDENLDVTLSSFKITKGALTFIDKSNRENFKTVLSPVSIEIANVFYGSRQSADCRISFDTDAQEHVALESHVTNIPFGAEGKLHLSEANVSRYRPYYNEMLPFHVQQGRADLDMDFSIAKENEPGAVSGALTLDRFVLKSFHAKDHGSDENMIDIPELVVSGAGVDLQNRVISGGAVSLKQARFLVKRNKDGTLNFSGKAAAPDGADQRKPAPLPGKTKPGPAGWKMVLDAFDGTETAVEFVDLTTEDPVNITLSDIRFHAENLQSVGGQKGRVSLKTSWNKSGRISISGDVIPSKKSASLDLSFNKLDIKSVQPYFTRDVKILAVNGDVNTSGKLELNLDKGSGNQIRFKGKASLTDFASLDKKTAKDFFKCESLYISGIDTAMFPLSLKIKDISLTDFYSRIIVSDTGETNLSTIFSSGKNEPQAGQEKDKKQEETVSQRPEISVENITLQGGRINFSDYLTQPNFTASMSQITGSVNGLSSQADTRAVLNLKGVHGQSSPLDITGKINPLAPKVYADIGVSFKDIELTDFTPYAAKYLGYKIEKGKLILDLSYHIDGNALQSENRFRFDNFTLGERTPSEDATSLPVSLAISLLKDRDGQINLDLPVSGQLDDPEFKIGAILFKMVANLILKVVTSPFSIIGSMFGSSDDLGYVVFEPGESALDVQNTEKLKILVEVLEKKPDVNLEIQSRYSPEEDGSILRLKQYEDLLKAEKLLALTAKGSDVNSLDDIRLAPEEEALYAARAYEKATFPKPMDKSGKEKAVEPAEKIKLLKTHIEMNENRLRELGMARSQAVKAHLLSSGKIQKERIFILEPRADEKENNAGIKTVFSLK